MAARRPDHRRHEPAKHVPAAKAVPPPAVPESAPAVPVPVGAGAERPSLRPLSDYEPLLAAAESRQGDSPGRRAWRRLRANRNAMLALSWLAAMAALTLLTPLLPLQSPRHIDLKRMYRPPVIFQAEAERLPELGAILADVASPPADRAAALDREIRNHFGGLFVWDRALIELRLTVFGDRCLPSLCGSDNLGRDVLARICWGSRVSLAVGLAAAFVSLLIGTSYGSISGYLGGWVDMLMMRIVDALYSIPFFFIVILVMTVISSVKDIPITLDESVWIQFLRMLNTNRLLVLFLAIGAVFWLTMARVVRGQVLSLKQELFVEAARTLGAGRTRIIFFHLVPNVAGVVIVYLTLTIPSVILFEAFLSFVGLGVEAPDSSFGVLAADGIQVLTPVKTAWWLVAFPGAILALLLLALNILGDGLRDALDPKRSKL